MAYSALVPPGEWYAVGPRHWVFIKADALNEGRPVRVTVHPDPFAIDITEMVPGLRVIAGPPDFNDFADLDGDPL